MNDHLTMRAVIFVNGQFRDPEIARSRLRYDDYIIAVNGGTHHALSIGVVPDAIIGDLDSLDVQQETMIRAASTQILRFPSRKDETDLELALHHAAVERQAASLLLIAALGGRLDQMLGNLMLLTLPCLQGIDAQIVEGAQTAFLIRDRAAIHGRPGDTVSILPVGGDAIGVSNEGLEWPLRRETLPSGTTRGISNVLTANEGAISVEGGMLLCVVTHHEKASLSDLHDV